jgi:hypothetical protein
MNKEKITINAIHEQDLEGFMRELGLWEDYKAGTLKCLCGKTITEENLSGFVPKNGKPYALHSILCKDNQPK